ncbi:universal stress protein [Streptomyces sp. NBC_01422]|uniref:universal stress protein n=1 Tax=Streptomyces sp. NBC_01422 TaxID=2903859 RepID=UPI002E2D1B57|nr:universal stress protein [Streptomyces sp. NBC_01422]
MTAQVTVGVDGSDESLAAAHWAAGEAVLREVPLLLVHVEEWPSTPEAPLPDSRQLDARAEALLENEADRVRREHPGLDVLVEGVRGREAEELTTAANEADLMVLGSRGLGGVLGFVIGSVSLAVAGAAQRPVVLVRARGEEAVAHSGIVAGVDIHHPCEPLLAFSFTEAARRRLPLHFLHVWKPPTSYGGYVAFADHGGRETLESHALGGLDDLLAPWRRRYPGVDVTARLAMGSSAYEIAEASRDAELVVVGRRTRRLPGVSLGHVAHAVIHHSPAPVAVVPPV